LTPCGIDAQTIRFLDTFLLFCLLSDSPKIDSLESENLSENMLRTVYQGRDSQLKLRRYSSELTLRDWGTDLLQQMQPVAEQLDGAHAHQHYTHTLRDMHSAITDSGNTPSETLLKEMQDNAETYYRMAMRKAQEHRDFFLSGELDTAVTDHYRQLAATSHEQQTVIENNDVVSFDQFLTDYWQSSQTD
jgi:glutamate--cysteine ligase